MVKHCLGNDHEWVDDALVVLHLSLAENSVEEQHKVTWLLEVSCAFDPLNQIARMGLKVHEDGLKDLPVATDGLRD